MSICANAIAFLYLSIGQETRAPMECNPQLCKMKLKKVGSREIADLKNSRLKSSKGIC